MVTKKSVLVVDDESKIIEVVQAYLINSGYEVFTAMRGSEGLRLFETKNPSMVLLDLMLPDLSGEEICATIRKKSRVPIIMLTAKVQDEDIVEGLMIGADDYITKPFSPKQLVARVDALFRRTSEDSELLFDSVSFNHGELSINIKTREVYINGVPVYLTPIEFNILCHLATNSKQVFSREGLIRYAMDEHFDGFDRVIDVHIKNLRKKIEKDPKTPQYIVTAYGLGYKFGAE